ncbi:MAG: ECF transporter S component [Candidatus Eisenbacteria bacterium]|nr:ECF transporter S component [Candidatus Eisenbacteria bacterium]
MTTATLTGTALLLAMGVALPIVFHMVPLGGRILLPMHLPAFLAGLLLGPFSGLVVGAGSPVLSMLVTGRPPVFYMLPMLFELATYGLVAGLLRPRFERLLGDPAEEVVPGRRSPAAVVLALLCAMITGRAVWVLVVVWLAPVLGIEARGVTAALAALGAGWIGMLIQLILIPSLVAAIERTRRA